MRNITNDYHDSEILNLGSDNDPGPYLVTQSGCSPRAEIPKTHMFVLRPDGQWADFNAYACQGKPEAMDEIIFSSMTKVMETFAGLRGPARVLELPLDKAGLEAWIARQKDADPLQAARAWAVQYKERQRKQPGAQTGGKSARWKNLFRIRNQAGR
jgi:hypothetical protein